MTQAAGKTYCGLCYMVLWTRNGSGVELQTPTPAMHQLWSDEPVQCQINTATVCVCWCQWP